MENKKLTPIESQRLVEHALSFMPQTELAEMLSLPSSRLSEAKRGKYRLWQKHLEMIEEQVGPMQLVPGEWLIAELLPEKVQLGDAVCNLVQGLTGFKGLLEFNNQLENSLGHEIKIYSPFHSKSPEHLPAELGEEVPSNRIRESFDLIIDNPRVRSFMRDYQHIVTDHNVDWSVARARIFDLSMKDNPRLDEYDGNTFSNALKSLGLGLCQYSREESLKICRIINDAIEHKDKFEKINGDLGMALPARLSFSSFEQRRFQYSINSAEYTIAAKHLFDICLGCEGLNNACSIKVDIYLAKNATYYLVVSITSHACLDRALIKSNVPYRKLLSTLKDIESKLGLSSSALTDHTLKKKLATHGGYIPSAKLLE